MNKNKFSYMDKEKAIPCPAGCCEKDEFQLVMDGNNKTLRKVGKINTQKLIESYRDAVDLGKMIERFKRGDNTALQRKNNAFFADVTGVDGDLARQIENQRLTAEYLANAPKKAETSKKEETPKTEPPKEEK